MNNILSTRAFSTIENRYNVTNYLNENTVNKTRIPTELLEDAKSHLSLSKLYFAKETVKALDKGDIVPIVIAEGPQNEDLMRKIPPSVNIFSYLDSRGKLRTAVNLDKSVRFKYDKLNGTVIEDLNILKMRSFITELTMGYVHDHIVKVTLGGNIQYDKVGRNFMMNSAKVYILLLNKVLRSVYNFGRNATEDINILNFLNGVFFLENHWGLRKSEAIDLISSSKILDPLNYLDYVDYCNIDDSFTLVDKGEYPIDKLVKYSKEQFEGKINIKNISVGSYITKWENYVSVLGRFPLEHCLSFICFLVGALNQGGFPYDKFVKDELRKISNFTESLEHFMALK